MESFFANNKNYFIVGLLILIALAVLEMLDGVRRIELDMLSIRASNDDIRTYERSAFLFRNKMTKKTVALTEIKEKEKEELKDVINENTENN